MPSGKLSCLVSGNARLLEDVSLPATVVIDVLGSAYHASSHINGRATSQDGETQVAADTSRDLESMFLHRYAGIWAGVWPGDRPRPYASLSEIISAGTLLLPPDLGLNEFACRFYRPCKAPFPLAVPSGGILATTTIRMFGVCISVAHCRCRNRSGVRS